MKKNILFLLAIMVLLAGNCFAGTSLQIHAETDRDPGNQKVITLTLDHFSTWDYGKNYFFLDITGKDGFKTEADLMYFEWHPSVSINKVLGWELSNDFIKEIYVAGKYGDGDKDFIDRDFLYGLSVDVDLGLEYFGISVYFKDFAEGEDSWQVTTCWSQSFEVVSCDLVFSGFSDYWINSNGSVLITEPQLRLPMSNFFQKGFLSQSAVGTEVEITHDFFGDRYGWEVNPTVFWVFEF